MPSETEGFIHTPHGRIYAEPSSYEKRVYAAVESVDLDIAFSPVLNFPLSEEFLSKYHLPVPIEVRKTGKGYILIHDPQKPAEDAEEVTPDELRLMRARFLIAKGLIDQNFRRLGHTAKTEAVANYFDGAYLELPFRYR
jgi:hypothetical protein